jgi:hypothetical protein
MMGVNEIYKSESMHVTVTNSYLLNQIKNILVVNKLYVTPVDLLPCVLLLLHFEDILRKQTPLVAWHRKEEKKIATR